MDRNYKVWLTDTTKGMVALHRSAWIEIQHVNDPKLIMAVALHRSAWIEMIGLMCTRLLLMPSHSTGVRG